MTLAPTSAERAARARSDLALGLPVEIGGWVAVAVETASDERLMDLAAREGATLALSARRAAALAIRAYDGDVARIAPRADPAWLRAVADPTRDLAAPMKGPFEAVREGDALPARGAVALARGAQLLPAVLMARAEAEGLSSVPPEAPLALSSPTVAPVIGARVPLAVSRAGRVEVFRPEAGGPINAAVEIGRPDRARPVLTRLHSACFTGDVLGSLKCDCGPQLHAALHAMAAEGAGVLLYLNQEGRGIGLTSKMRAYSLQDQGYDTVEANHRLGFEDDERDFRLGAEMLRAMGIGAVRLMTNNPRKIAMLEAEGITVAERVPLHVGRGPENAGYLDVKRLKSGHLG